MRLCNHGTDLLHCLLFNCESLFRSFILALSYKAMARNGEKTRKKKFQQEVGWVKRKAWACPRRAEWSSRPSGRMFRTVPCRSASDIFYFVRPEKLSAGISQEQIKFIKKVDLGAPLVQALYTREKNRRSPSQTLRGSDLTEQGSIFNIRYLYIR